MRKRKTSFVARVVVAVAVSLNAWGQGGAERVTTEVMHPDPPRRLPRRPRR